MLLESNLYQPHAWAELLISIVGACLIAYCSLIFIKRFPTHLFQQWKEDSEDFLENLPQTLAEGPKAINNWLFYCCFILAVAIAWYFLGLNYEFLSVVLFITLIVPIAVIDWQYLFILDLLVYPLLWAGILLNLYGVFTPIHLSIFGAVLGYLIIAVPEKLYEWVRKQPGIGFGDAKLCAAIGAWIGAQHLLILCLVSFGLAIIGFIIQGIKGKATDKESKPLPFGPSLAITGFILLLWG